MCFRVRYYQFIIFLGPSHFNPESLPHSLQYLESARFTRLQFGHLRLNLFSNSF